MMSEDEHKYVLDYLIYKQVSFDLLPEVHDHFSAEINDYMKEGLSFHQAFDQTDKTWEVELKKVYLNSFTLYKAPHLVAKMNQIENYRIIKKALIFAISVALLSALVLLLSDFRFLRILFISSIIFTVIPYIWLVVNNYEAFKMRDKVLKRNLNFSFFRNPEILYILIISVANLVFNGIKIGGILENYKLIIAIVFTFLIIFSSVYTVLALTQIFKSYDKMKPYLKHIFE